VRMWDEVLVTVLGGVAIAWINWYFLPRKGR
jgi:hypothetical protein